MSSQSVTATLAQLSPRRRRRRPVSTKLVVGLSITGAIVLFGLVAPLFVGDPFRIRPIGITPPSAEFWLGTTQKGQDIFAQLAVSTTNSLLIGVVVGVLSLVLSAFFGIVGAYLGRWFDEGFSLITNIALVIPGLPLIIVVSSYVESRGLGVVALILALTSWAGGARVLRAVTLSLRNRDYVAAARVAGERTFRIITVEILPNLLPILASSFIFGVVSAILAEAGLSYLGLGVTGDYTWGRMLYDAQMNSALRAGAWWWFVPPGLLIATLGAALSLVNFALDEIVNPKLRLPVAARPRRKALS
ncbi:putative ABC transporter permease protein [Microbacterium sp. TS-1]|jgi:peptide/nickel transport system permease protein|uniref:Peptide/nickel transport system permease protein n=2 Tax=Microbacterium TaxID=33882 RepID=A0ABU1I1T3_9MICO|nr:MULTISPECIES: ABC transporter permease [Microbacterium]APF34737.1 ABC transporter permease [Microbacterium paludicola]MDR6167842.1 peptide/nickel transport system permease protein [Microbacterium paludicola]OAZ41697.1 ABC transporter permease [Microbacterium arborescens]POX68424.1 ABC transporter permease [Microbacterium sp. Ru50]QCR41697.1 ABC transporter permease [Microbacterium sp. SGAir0570]